jgi:3-hydroxyacyl-CoA dehydrogenase
MKTFDMSIRKVLIVGAGNLGQQVGFQCAMHGFETVMYGRREASLAACRAAHGDYAELFRKRGRNPTEIDAALARISYTTDLAAAGHDADLVSESVPEDPAVKSQIYPLLNEACPPRTIFTTNTSTLLPSQFADVTGRRDRFLALHFANEIWDRNVAEVMGHPGTDPHVFEVVVQFARAIGMVPIRVGKEQNGYVMNSLSVPWLMAAQALVTNDVAKPQDVDRTWMITMQTALGPFGVLDMVGLETAYNIAAYWGAVKGDEQLQRNAAYLKENFVDRNKLGMKTGEGYYKHPNPAYQQPGFLA